MGNLLNNGIRDRGKRHVSSRPVLGISRQETTHNIGHETVAEPFYSIADKPLPINVSSTNKSDEFEGLILSGNCTEIQNEELKHEYSISSNRVPGSYVETQIQPTGSLFDMQSNITYDNDLDSDSFSSDSDNSDSFIPTCAISLPSTERSTSIEGNTYSVDSTRMNPFSDAIATSDVPLRVVEHSPNYATPTIRISIGIRSGNSTDLPFSAFQFQSVDRSGNNDLSFLSNSLFHATQGDSGGTPMSHVDLLSRMYSHSDLLQRIIRSGNDLSDDDRLIELLMGQEELHTSRHVNVERLPTKKYVKRTVMGDESCDICTDIYVVGDEQKTLPCFHDYHTVCIDKWLQTNSTCPVCRMDVRTDGDELQAQN